jgi:hypothetical protein
MPDLHNPLIFSVAPVVAFVFFTLLWQGIAVGIPHCRRLLVQARDAQEEPCPDTRTDSVSWLSDRLSRFYQVSSYLVSWALRPDPDFRDDELPAQHFTEIPAAPETASWTARATLPEPAEDASPTEDAPAVLDQIELDLRGALDRLTELREALEGPTVPMALVPETPAVAVAQVPPRRRNRAPVKRNKRPARSRIPERSTA